MYRIEHTRDGTGGAWHSHIYAYFVSATLPRVIVFGSMLCFQETTTPAPLKIPQ